ncbi:PREDICTED: uncharacterized protein LOC105460669, partial [Wasmannia auropunctata]|uniref:uncharacterized protein LOC105460669 n=1 Tax=Wasmannia auropunctata TaxID=64793 RepID=UPI0005F0A927
EVSTSDACVDTKNKGTYENVHICEDDDTLVIEPQGDLDKNRIQDHEPEGNRIIDISFFHKELHRTFDNHARGIECQFKDWHLVNSRRHGLMTQFFYKCKMCHYKTNFWSHPRD